METLLRKSVVYDKYIFKDYFDGSSEDQNATGVVKTVLMRLGSKNTIGNWTRCHSHDI